MNALAILDRPKFQFNAKGQAGLNLRSIGKGKQWTGSDLLGLGKRDHFINRPFRVYQGHWPTGEIRRPFAVSIKTA